MKRENRGITIGFIGALLLLLGVGVTAAAPGDLLATVTLPGNGDCSVAGTFDGTYYMTINTNGCVGTTIGVYQPPVGNGAAALVSSKNIVDAGNNPVSISALAWDPGRIKLWGAYNDQVYLIDIGDPTQNTDAVATFQFQANVVGLSLVDGLAYDGGDDTIYYSPDVDQNVYHFSLGTGANPPLGTLMNTVTPENANGVADGLVSGVVVGSGNTLYIGRDGAAEIRRVDKTTGAFISQFATTSGRVEDLTCDPVTYAPIEAVLSKDAYNGLYEAFEVESGTCPLPKPKGSISGMKFEDLNGNGVNDAEPGLANWIITLSNQSGIVATQDTGPTGSYNFTNLTADNYTVAEVLQPGWNQTAPQPVPPGTYTVNLSAGENVVGNDFGNIRTPIASCIETVNPAGKNVPPAGSTTLPGSKGGQNEDGFYELQANNPLAEIFVKDTGSGTIFPLAPPGFSPGTKIKYTEANGATPSIKNIGGPNSAVDWHITGTGDAAVYAVVGIVKGPEVLCKVPPPPK